MPVTKHIRQQIREKVQTVLTGLTTTGARVYMTRTNPLSEEDGELPGLVIGANQKSPTMDHVVDRSIGSQVTARNRATLRTMRLPLAGYHKVATGLEDALDTISKEVEVAMFADPLLGGLVVETRMMDTSISINGDGDKPIGEVLMNFEADYWCMEGAPDTVIA